MNRKIIAVRRDFIFSLNAEQKDRAILEAVIRRLGGNVPIIDEAQLTDACRADIFLSMGRKPQTLHLLGRKMAEGARVVNRPDAVEVCTRRQIEQLMRQHRIPMPPVKGEHGYWLKRGDALAQKDTDVIYCHDEQELVRRKIEWRRKGIDTSIASAHVEGDLIKFYCVGHSFFRWYRLHTAERGYTFSPDSLHREACRLANAIGIEIFGGDCIVDRSGRFSIIDFNDWPSFGPCRDEAADAIAQLLERI